MAKKGNKGVYEWIPVKRRPLTEEEIEEYGDKYYEMWDCKLPEESDTVLVTYVCENYGTVHKEVDYTEYDAEDKYFENFNEDIIAWMPFPAPYEGEEDEY